MINQIVNKPWGREYLAYRNPEVAIWVLEIKKGTATSLHCHPHKNTALIILQGAVGISFIRDNVPHRFRGLDKINIFQGRFHRTRAASDGVVLLEIESPDDKRDIVRLEDDYGREASPIEEATTPLDETCLLMQEESHLVEQFAGCLMEIVHPTTTEEISREPGEHIFVTLKGGLDRGLVPAGDAIDRSTLIQLTRTFKIVPNSAFLHIWRP